ncbi:MAG TPA: MSMEG_1061 family FMN-dependent PPOX-type flavoprotein [Longimicrobiaceae bacterium]|nr:MSMEG_1061 family FMN-dependent PPOX-type flavoprotein [Longimicrobiaceae bacterium]
MSRLETVEQLEDWYGTPSYRAARKERDHLDEHCRRFIRASPFLVLATADADGNCEVSPRGDRPGFVRVVDRSRLHIPDRTGNNRVDSARNVVGNPKVALLFLVPGMEETLRVRGSVSILTDEALREEYAAGGRAARAVWEVVVERAFFQCQKALIRSRLWDPEGWSSREELGLAPLSRVLADQIEGLTPEVSERMTEESIRDRLW